MTLTGGKATNEQHEYNNWINLGNYRLLTQIGISHDSNCTYLKVIHFLTHRTFYFAYFDRLRLFEQFKSCTAVRRILMFCTVDFSFRHEDRKFDSNIMH